MALQVSWQLLCFWFGKDLCQFGFYEYLLRANTYIIKFANASQFFLVAGWIAAVQRDWKSSLPFVLSYVWEHKLMWRRKHCVLCESHGSLRNPAVETIAIILRNVKIWENKHWSESEYLGLTSFLKKHLAWSAGFFFGAYGHLLQVCEHGYTYVSLGFMIWY